MSIVATGPTLTAWGYRSTHPLFLSCVQAIYPGKQAEIYRMARGAFRRNVCMLDTTDGMHVMHVHTAQTSNACHVFAMILGP